MPTVSIYLNDEDYSYYRALEKKSQVIHWCLEQHRKLAEKKIEQEEPVIVKEDW